MIKGDGTQGHCDRLCMFIWLKEIEIRGTVTGW